MRCKEETFKKVIVDFKFDCARFNVFLEPLKRENVENGSMLDDVRVSLFKEY
jgi:hypothetical protein